MNEAITIFFCYECGVCVGEPETMDTECHNCAHSTVDALGGTFDEQPARAWLYNHGPQL